MKDENQIVAFLNERIENEFDTEKIETYEWILEEFNERSVYLFLAFLEKELSKTEYSTEHVPISITIEFIKNDF